MSRRLLCSANQCKVSSRSCKDGSNIAQGRARACARKCAAAAAKRAVARAPMRPEEASETQRVGVGAISSMREVPLHLCAQWLEQIGQQEVVWPHDGLSQQRPRCGRLPRNARWHMEQRQASRGGEHTMDDRRLKRQARHLQCRASTCICRRIVQPMLRGSAPAG